MLERPRPQESCEGSSTPNRLPTLERPRPRADAASGFLLKGMLPMPGGDGALGGYAGFRPKRLRRWAG